jgi:hypothetical protein
VGEADRKRRGEGKERQKGEKGRKRETVRDSGREA